MNCDFKNWFTNCTYLQGKIAENNTSNSEIDQILYDSGNEADDSDADPNFEIISDHDSNSEMSSESSDDDINAKTAKLSISVRHVRYGCAWPTRKWYAITALKNEHFKHQYLVS